MKIGCSVDVIHFPQDFEDTLKSPCNFWGDCGMANMSKENKKKIWDWVFSMPADEIAIMESISMIIEFKGVPFKEEDKWENRFPGYNDLTEAEQPDLQRQSSLAQPQGTAFSYHPPITPERFEKKPKEGEVN